MADLTQEIRDARQRRAQERKQARVLTPEIPQEDPKVLGFLPGTEGVSITPYTEDKSLARKAGEDLALIGQGFTTGLSQIAAGLAGFGTKEEDAFWSPTKPFKTVGELAYAGTVQSFKDLADPQYYKEHPLLAGADLILTGASIASVGTGFLVKAPIMAAIKIAMNAGVKQGLKAAVIESALRTGIKIGGKQITKGALGHAVEVGIAKNSLKVVRETAISLLGKKGVVGAAADVVADTLVKDLTKSLARNQTRNNILSRLAHPLAATTTGLKVGTGALRSAVFGAEETSGVGIRFTSKVVSQNPEAFRGMENWAGQQVVRDGLENTPKNRASKISQWEAENPSFNVLSPEQKAAHFVNYAKASQAGEALSASTGVDGVVVKAVDKNTTDAMVQTIRDAADGEDFVNVLKQNGFEKELRFNEEEIRIGLAGKTSKEAVIKQVINLSKTGTTIIFKKLSPEDTILLKDISDKGYRFGYAPKGREIIFAEKVAGAAGEAAEVEIGATSFKGRTVSTIAETKPYYDSSRAKGFEKSLTELGESNNVKVESVEKAGGLYEGKLEPSFLIRVKGTIEDIVTYLGKTQENIRGKQDAFIAFKAGVGSGAKYTFVVKNTDLAIQKTIKAGIKGATAIDGKNLLIYDIDGSLASQIANVSEALKIKPTKTNGTVKFIERAEYEAAAAKRGVGDISEVAAGRGRGVISEQSLTVTRSLAQERNRQFLDFVKNIGLSAEGVPVTMPMWEYARNFGQHLLGSFAEKHGGKIRLSLKGTSTKITLPVNKVYDWLESNIDTIALLREKSLGRLLTGRSRRPQGVFDLSVEDFRNLGLSKEIANDLETIARRSRREISASVIGAGEKVVNYLRTGGNPLSRAFDTFINTANLGRYTFSPFFVFQTFFETHINAALMLKNPLFLPGVRSVARGGVATVDWFARKVNAQRAVKWTENAKSYINDILGKPTFNEEIAFHKTVAKNFGTEFEQTSFTTASQLERHVAKGKLAGKPGKLPGIKEVKEFEAEKSRRNIISQLVGASIQKTSTQFGKGIAKRFGMTLEEALDYTVVDGKQVFKNPEVVKTMREQLQTLLHYKDGMLTSPLVKTLNVVFFPMRFQMKSIDITARWFGSLSPASRIVVANNWIHFSQWAGTDEGKEWRRTNMNTFFRVLEYSTAHQQIGDAIDAVTRGNLFGGNAGLIGGVPFGFIVEIARNLGYFPDDPEQYNPKTGERFEREAAVQGATLAQVTQAIEEIVGQMMPGTPVYTLTGGLLSGSIRSWVQRGLIRPLAGIGRQLWLGEDPREGKREIERDFEYVPLGE